MVQWSSTQSVREGVSPKESLKGIDKGTTLIISALLGGMLDAGGVVGARTSIWYRAIGAEKPSKSIVTK